MHMRGAIPVFACFERGGHPGLRNFQFTPLSYRSRGPFLLRIQEMFGQMKAREGMQQAHGIKKKKKKSKEGGLLYSYFLTRRFASEGVFSKGRKGKEVTVAMLIFPVRHR